MQSTHDRFICELQQANSLDDLQAVITGLREYVEVEHLIYHSVKSTGEQYAALTYSQDWVRHYLERDYARIDPVVRGCFTHFQPVDWKTLDWSARNVRTFMAEAIDAGVGNQGLSVPIRGPAGQFALFTVSSRSSDSAWARFKGHHTRDMILFAHFVNQRALEIEGAPGFRESSRLSPREVDALTMLAMGLNRPQAAEWLAISEHTLRAYVESAREKLGAQNTTHAVAMAVAMGFVSL
jgi:DNA-binding CsgD family transcriptional regulator